MENADLNSKKIVLTPDFFESCKQCFSTFILNAEVSSRNLVS